MSYGLQHKLGLFYYLDYFILLKSYLHSRHFLVKVETECTEHFPVNTGVPQSSALGPLLHLLYNADLPTLREPTTVIFPDDTAVLATDSDPGIASQKLQANLDISQNG
jgi:hypothetical protein